MKWVFIVIAVMVAVAALYLLLLLIIGRVRRRADLIEASLRGEGVVRLTRKANFFGRSSHKYAEMKGNGVLALTTEDLVFIMLYPNREYRIPLRNIVKIEHPKCFRSRTVGKELLVVEYMEEQTGGDSIGILVPGPREWAGEIRDYAWKYHTRSID